MASKTTKSCRHATGGGGCEKGEEEDKWSEKAVDME